MNRQNWLFPYKVDDILDGAKKKLAFHTKRFAWWEKKSSAVMKAIKKEGLEISESVALGYTNKSNRAPQVQIKNTLLDDMSECQEKIAEHKQKVKEFESWVQVLGSSVGTQDLHYDDWLYFFSEK